MSSDPDALVTLLTTTNQFEAHTIVATLAEAGIEAHAFDALAAGIRIGLVGEVPVQVRACDLARANDALRSNIADSIDLDWDAVDVGDEEQGGTTTAAGPGAEPRGWRAHLAILAVVLAIITIAMLLARGMIS
jgi:Putative prokaryotic signal transducing protein